MNIKLNNLGSRTGGQKSISGEVNIDLINKIYLNKINIFKEFTENSKDENAIKLYEYFKLNKKFNFTINKNYYRSELVLFYYSEYRIWIETFISMYRNYLELLDATVKLIDLEINEN